MDAGWEDAKKATRWADRDWEPITALAWEIAGWMHIPSQISPPFQSKPVHRSNPNQSSIPKQISPPVFRLNA